MYEVQTNLFKPGVFWKTWSLHFAWVCYFVRLLDIYEKRGAYVWPAATQQARVFGHGS